MMLSVADGAAGNSASAFSVSSICFHSKFIVRMPTETGGFDGSVCFNSWRSFRLFTSNGDLGDETPSKWRRDIRDEHPARLDVHRLGGCADLGLQRSEAERR